ncbi:hypothetical protein HCB17_08970 [Salinispora arenicola]|uniref:hypothetical protein n=1 Tax=Salinispora arenicola TaxID=168697 RepID=UPI001431E382|nr:hypothetical protein [Salinispora arenicola]NIL41294.1 hypothetical protein [Salinispora arenicola]
MSSLLAQVVAQLNSAIQRLDALAVAATRAQADIQEGHGLYTTAGQGSAAPNMRVAADASRTAADKAERLGRLNSLAAQHLTRYVNVVVPGSAPSHEAIDSPTLSGGDLLADSQRREAARANVGGFLNRQVRKADELQEQTTNATQAVQHSIKILRNPNGPRGAQSTGTGTPTAPAMSPRPKIDAAEAAGSLVVVGLLAGVAAHRITAVIRSRVTSLRRRRDDTG